MRETTVARTDLRHQGRSSRRRILAGEISEEIRIWEGRGAAGGGYSQVRCVEEMRMWEEEDEVEVKKVRKKAKFKVLQRKTSP